METVLGSLVNVEVFGRRRARKTVTRDATIPIENSAAVVVVGGFIAAGDPSVRVWRFIPTPDYDYRKMAGVRTPERMERRKKKRKVGIESVAIVDPVFSTLVRFHRRQLAQQQQRMHNLVESDEEFLIITGQL